MRLKHLLVPAVFFCLPAFAKADSCSSTLGNLVVNCGFESGSFLGWSGFATMNQDSGVDTFNPYQGDYAAVLGSVGTTTMLTQLLHTEAGQQYTLQFALANDQDPGGQANEFSALFGDAVLFSQTNASEEPYELYTMTGTASASTTRLSFLSRNDPGYFFLDDISVVPTVTTTQTPEPSSLALLGTGLLGMAHAARKRRALQV